MHVDSYMKHFTVGYDWTLRWLYEGSYCKKAYIALQGDWQGVHHTASRGCIPSSYQIYKMDFGVLYFPLNTLTNGLTAVLTSGMH